MVRALGDGKHERNRKDLTQARQARASIGRTCFFLDLFGAAVVNALAEASVAGPEPRSNPKNGKPSAGAGELGRRLDRGSVVNAGRLETYGKRITLAARRESSILSASDFATGSMRVLRSLACRDAHTDSASARKAARMIDKKDAQK